MERNIEEQIVTTRTRVQKQPKLREIDDLILTWIKNRTNMENIFTTRIKIGNRSNETDVVAPTATERWKRPQNVFRNSNQNRLSVKTKRDSRSHTTGNTLKCEQKRVFETEIRIDQQSKLRQLVAITETSSFEKVTRKWSKIGFSKVESESKNSQN